MAANNIYNFSEEQKFKTPKTKIEPLTNAAFGYLTEKRGFRKETLEAYRIGCVKNFGDFEIALPCYDENDVLRLVKFRHPTGGKIRRVRTDKESGEKEEYFVKTAAEPGGKSILFGSHLCDPAEGPLIICFGDYDAMSVAQSGVPNAVSLPFGDGDRGFFNFQWNFLSSFSEITLFNDRDTYPSPEAKAAAIKKLDELATRLGKERLRIVRDEDRFDTKDANELLLKKGAESVRKAVENAIPYPVGIVAVADHEETRMQDGTPIGLPSVDKATNGLNGGELMLISGDNGAGKTTEALNIAAEFIERDIPVFLWSGEQTVGKIRYWFERIVAGRMNLKRTVSEQTGFEYYFPCDDVIDRIRNWYRNYLFQYTEVNITPEKFFQTARIGVQRHGCGLIVIDNLMAFTGGEGENYYQSQGDFAESCKRFAQTMNIPVILICHNKKEELMAGKKLKLPDKNSVEGSKKVTSWADILIQLVRIPETFKTDFENADSVARLCKARESGMLKDILLKFEPESSRFWQKSADNGSLRRYGWEEWTASK